MGRRVSRIVKIGGFNHPGPAGSTESLSLGGDFPVVIQTMWKDGLSFSDLEGEGGERLMGRILGLKAMGCGLLRFAVPDLEAAEVLGRLAAMVPMPLVADIHFDYKIALRCLDFPIAKIRINPGNIGGRDRVEAVLGRAAEKGVPIRIGVNGGSLPRDLRRRVDEGMDRAEALAEAAERELAVFRDFDFSPVVVSLKASSPAETIRANRVLAGRTETPFHIGLTEAGPLVAGVAGNTAALLALLREGIGDTIRVSLSDTMENEVIAGREILRIAGDLFGDADSDSDVGDNVGGGAGTVASGAARGGRFGRGGVSIVSCPRCGRNGFDTHSFAERWLGRLYRLDKNITVAIMGCAVNGPEEARHADLGITGAGNKVLLFRRGKVVRTIEAAEADSAFLEELEKL
ncbi:MAG: (E)-4-hydroxy-3-methylbut-2-enyl-diphosphate synthase [Spirochaetaceae bacterium]|jgi:(E)-4-hydroxy-3-methylbut-2-enyl-diphosphate synthase|nr:(E)-4-hydroxy-3-methylbut-2-enyl-diphosphate synthase [Spirochaetaceae bacterium]